VYSSDGETWTAVEDDVFENNVQLYAIAYGGGKFVTGRRGDGHLTAYSSDGITWTKVEGAGAGINAIAYGGGRFVTVGGNGKIMYSNKVE
jgi:hypothetical protein